MKVSVKIDSLLAANLFASKEATRHYLNGVYLEDKGSCLNLVATDGHRLIKIPEWMEDDTREPDFSFIIPSGLLKQIKRIKGLTHCDLEYDDETKMITISYNDNKYAGYAVNGTFPPYECLIPELPKNHHGTTQISFNPKYLAEFAKINELMGHKDCGIKMTIIDNANPTIITMGGNASVSEKYLALLMPTRV
jgi:hypothetical protein